MSYTPQSILEMFHQQGVYPRGISKDSRSVRQGDIFAAVPGTRGGRHGREYIDQALSQGAVAILQESDNNTPSARSISPSPNVASNKIAWLSIPQLKQYLLPLADIIYEHPTTKTSLSGVTGTNGKTSVSQWLSAALSKAGHPCAFIGTLGAGYGEWQVPLHNTTPEELQFRSLLKDMVDRNIFLGTAEISSIGLDQNRIQGLPIDTAIFTNLSQDHLDYHGSMLNYQTAKMRLFSHPGLQRAIINVDDPLGAHLITTLENQMECIGCSLIDGHTPDHQTSLKNARLVAKNSEYTDRGVSFDLYSEWGKDRVTLPVLGNFNIRNMLLVLASLLSRGITWADALQVLSDLRPPLGRMNFLFQDRTPLVVIDYAHTPDALLQALSALRPISTTRKGKLTVVFGCGGERDQEKRPLMGKIAQELADQIIITSDNPRRENPDTIIADIAKGAPQAKIEANRGTAIAQSIHAAAPEDLILIDGKGHETYQIIGTKQYPFSDHAVAQTCLEQYSKREASHV